MTDMNEIKLNAFEIESNEPELNKPTKPINDGVASAAIVIKNLLFENGAEADEFEIKSALEELVEGYNVPLQEAQRSVTNSFLKKYGISKTKVFSGKGTAETKTISEITAVAGKSDIWVNVTGKVIQLWENHHESIAQVGLIGDETGVVKFTLWNSAGLNPLELNQTYNFKNVVVKFWNGKAGVDLNKAATVDLSDKELDIRRPDFENPKERVNELRKVAELNQNNQWTDLKAKIVQLFENTHESIAYAGILGDETGTMRFTVWKATETENEKMEAGKSYLLTNAIAKEWNGNFVIEVSRIGKVEEILDDIVAKPNVFEIIGCAVDVQAGSGLIRRCPECSKVLSKGNCSEHGKVKGEHDLRIKAVFDDGAQAYETIINCGLTQKLLNIRVEDAVLMAAEELDSECINDLIKREFIGKYYTVKGFKTDRYVISESVDLLDNINYEGTNYLKEIISEELSREFSIKNKAHETTESETAETEVI